MNGRIRNATIVLTVIASMTSGVACADGLKIGGTGAAQGIMILLSDAFKKASTRADTVEVVAGLGSSGGIAAVTEGALQFAVSGR